METMPYTADKIRQFDLVSDHGDTYQISVCLPANWGAADTKHSVLLAPDGGLYLGTLGGPLPGVAYFNPALQNVMIVTIGYGLVGWIDPVEIMRRRTRDLTHVANAGVDSFNSNMIGGVPVSTGGADDFLSFVRGKVLPTLEQEFRADAHGRTLFAGSLGGDLAFYTLLTQPELFDHYCIFSPALGIGGRPLFELEDEYARSS